MPNRRRRTPILPILVVLAGWLVAAPVAASQEAPSATGPRLLADGVGSLPAGSVAWRVVEDVAEPPGAAAFEERALGFLLNAQPLTGPLLVTDQATGRQTVVEPGAAAFVPEGASERRESQDGTATSYLRLALVPSAERRDPGGDRLVFAGGPFVAPAGERVLALYRDELRPGETDTFVGASAPVLVLVLQGAVTVRADAGVETLTTVVGGGTSYAAGVFPGPVTIAGHDRGISNEEATLVVATVGERVGEGAFGAVPLRR